MKDNCAVCQIIHCLKNDANKYFVKNLKDLFDLLLKIKKQQKFQWNSIVQ